MCLNCVTMYFRLFFSSFIIMSYQRMDSDTATTGPTPPLLTTSTTATPTPVVLYSTPDMSHERFQGRTAVILGIVQVVGGIVSILSQSVLIGIMSIAMYIGAGFWCGIPVS